MKLSKKLETLILAGCKQAGSYSPDDILPRIEEQLTVSEYQVAKKFLEWIFEGITNNPEEWPGRRFGTGLKMFGTFFYSGATIQDRFKEFCRKPKI